MASKSRKRGFGTLIVVGLLLGACSGSDDESPTSEEPPASEVPPTSEDGLQGEGLALGLLAPPTGLLSVLVQGQERGAAFAVTDVDDGGGVLEGPLTVTSYPVPTGGEAIDGVDAAVAAGSAALIGPASSDDALAVRDAVGEADSITCSASATVPRITLDQTEMSLFRTALPDDVTTTYLTSAIEERRDAAAPDAPWKVAIVARSDEYGLSVGNGLAATLAAAGMEPTVVNYNPNMVLFTTVAPEVTAIEPDVTVLVTYAEGANLLSTLVQEGLDPATMIGLDAFFAPRIATRATAGVDVSTVDGFTLLGSMGNRAFLQRLYDDDPNGEVSNAAQAYDCAVVLALATEAVADGSSATMAEAVVAVSGEGVTCTTYEDCLDKLQAGENIDYDGVSGELAIDEHGDPTWARFTTAILSGGAVTDISSTDVDIAAIRRQQEAYASAAMITKVQQALRFLGFYSGPINGLDTDEYRAALAAFQASVGLPATGIYDEATDAALRAALGPYGELLNATTSDIQRLMTDLGFYSGPIDGIWNADLTAAIKAMQRELGVPETGVLDAATVRAIYARGGQDATPETTVPPETTAPPTTAPPTTPPPTVPPTLPPVEEPTLFEVLSANPQFSKFVQLVIAAGYTDDMSVIGPFTVFAPTNDAISDDELAALLADPDLAALLAYYVVEEAWPVARIATVTELDTLYGGEPLPVAGTGADLTVGGAKIVIADQIASNGMVQGIDALLTPPALPDE